MSRKLKALNNLQQDFRIAEILGHIRDHKDRIDAYNQSNQEEIELHENLVELVDGTKAWMITIADDEEFGCVMVAEEAPDKLQEAREELVTLYLESQEDGQA